MCVYVYLYIYIYTHVYIHICIYTYTCIDTPREDVADVARALVLLRRRRL